MFFLEWKENYNVGVKEIDIQHRGLFDLVSKLSNTKNIYKNEKYFIATLDLFIQYAKVHFNTEERYMFDAQYNKHELHKKEHDEFIKAISDLSDKLQKESSDELFEKILFFIKDWYGSHILGTDRDYIEIFHQKGFK